jgi:hypothetical protein
MDNSIAIGVTNLTIITRKTKSIDLCLWWLRCRVSQQQFNYYWDKGSHNWEDYHTKHLPPISYKANRPIHASAAGQLLLPHSGLAAFS